MDKPATPLPCPFCGEQCAVLNEDIKWAGYQPSCLEVRTGYDSSPDAEWRAEAIDAWNRRVPDLTAINAELVEALRRLEYWFNTDEEILDAMDHNTRADHERQLGIIRNAIARAMLTASVDAEPTAWLYEHPEAKPLLRHSRFPMSVPGWTEIPLYTEAQMQARADAARREGERAGLEKALKIADEATDECQRWKQPGKWVAKSIATAFAAGKAAREREIVEWLRGQEFNYECGFGDDGVRASAIGMAADAIERGEV